MEKRKFELNTPKVPLQKQVIVQKKFNYTKDDVSLNFTLNMDTKMLKAFRECLEEAIKDIDETLEENK